MNRLIQNFEVIDLHLQRKGLADRRKGYDDLALLAEFRHYALSSCKDAVTHPHPCSHGDTGMGPQEQSACQSGTNLVEFRAAYHVSFSIAQQVKHAGGGDDGGPVLRQEAGKHIPRKERAFSDDGSVAPLYALGVERQIVLHRTHNKVLRNSPFMVRDHM